MAATKLFCLVALFLVGLPQICRPGVGITPEQIYQPEIAGQLLIGTWEALPEENPLAEGTRSAANGTQRTLMTLRKDGTCRIFNEDHPTGSDGLWDFQSQSRSIIITFPNGSSVQHFVYGIRDGYMVTRSGGKNGRDQLWSAVK
ncbi:MAG: hypothetical protein FJ118_02735 [Deltaproteobacteria bacterium]|nr:hypothetical protein [Deltaproteobacteria bacterium]